MPEAQSSALRGHSQPSTARPFSARFCMELAGSESVIAVFVVTNRSEYEVHKCDAEDRAQWSWGWAQSAGHAQNLFRAGVWLRLVLTEPLPGAVPGGRGRPNAFASSGEGPVPSD